MKWPRRTHDPIPGHGSAWTGFVVGIGASIAANVLHAMEGTWTYPELVGAAFWPTALLISVEILTRVAWPHGWQWIVTRFAGVIVVALVAAALSYLHMRSLLLSWGEGAFQATIGPAAVDGLMLISATALLAVSRSKLPAAAPAALLEQTVPIGVDAAGQQIATSVLAHLPQIPPLPQPIVLGKSSALRIPLGRRGRRSGTVAGRRRLSVVPSLESTPAPPPAPPAQVNGHAHPLGQTAPPPPPKPTPKKPDRKSGRRAAGALDQASYDKAFRFWQSEQAQGRTPSAQAIADVIGRSKATGGRLQQDFKSAVSVTP